MIKTFKLNKKVITIIVLILVYLLVATFSYSKKTSLESYVAPFILIDAGHGNPDGGAVGVKTGVFESNLNLEYALTLKSYFKSLNCKVELIRSSLQGLDEDKTIDMEKRKAIIEKSKCDILISIHMNKFNLPSSRGAQVFYKIDDDHSKLLAENIRDLFVKNLEYARELTLPGDYMVLNSAPCPAVLVECGFLSNELDETRLQTKEYREKLCYQIFCGAIKYFNFSQ